MAVWDLDGNPVFRSGPSKILPGRNAVAWAGKDSSGVFSPSGIYSLEIVVEHPGSLQDNKNILFKAKGRIFWPGRVSRNGG